MKRSLIAACIVVAALNANAQNATDKGPITPQPKVIGQVPETKAPVVSPPVAAKDIKPTADAKLNNSALNMPKPVKGNDPDNAQKAVSAKTAPVMVTPPALQPGTPAKPVEVKKPVPQQQDQ